MWLIINQIDWIPSPVRHSCLSETLNPQGYPQKPWVTLGRD